MRLLSEARLVRATISLNLAVAWNGHHSVEEEVEGGVDDLDGVRGEDLLLSGSLAKPDGHLLCFYMHELNRQIVVDQ